MEKFHRKPYLFLYISKAPNRRKNIHCSI
jgi:hypothetical protein